MDQAKFQSAPRLVAAENVATANATIDSILFQSAPRLVAAENVAAADASGSPAVFQSAPRLVAAENHWIRSFASTGEVSIRSAACGRGEHLAPTRIPVTYQSFNPLRGLWPRRTIQSLGSAAALPPFQSAPRLVAAENGTASTGAFNVSGVSIRSAACGRGEPQSITMAIGANTFQSAPRLVAAENYHLFLFTGAMVLFQSAPRLVAAENVTPDDMYLARNVSIRSAACSRGEPWYVFIASSGLDGFNPLRGLWPRRTKTLSSVPVPTSSFNPLRGLWPRRTRQDNKELENRYVSIRSAACGRGERIAPGRQELEHQFQSAPRLVAAENASNSTFGKHFNVSIRSAACGRGEPPKTG